MDYEFHGLTSTDHGLITFDSQSPLLVFSSSELARWLRILDEMAETPLHRKIMYAAADAIECCSNFNLNIPRGWRRMKNFAEDVKPLWNDFGWGMFHPHDSYIDTSFHQELSEGFALALMESFHQKRLTPSSRYVNDQTIQLSFSASGRPMMALSPLSNFDWEHKQNSTQLVPFTMDIDRRERAWFIDDQRSALIPNEFFRRLYSVMLPLTFDTKHRHNELLEIRGVQSLQIHVIRSAILAAFTGEYTSNSTCFVNDESDWVAHLDIQVKNRGYGLCRIHRYDTSLNKSCTIWLEAINSPYLIGKIWALWEKSVGCTTKLIVDCKKNAIILNFSSYLIEG